MRQIDLRETTDSPPYQKGKQYARDMQAAPREFLNTHTVIRTVSRKTFIPLITSRKDTVIETRIPIPDKIEFQKGFIAGVNDMIIEYKFPLKNMGITQYPSDILTTRWGVQGYNIGIQGREAYLHRRKGEGEMTPEERNLFENGRKIGLALKVVRKNGKSGQLLSAEDTESETEKAYRDVVNQRIIESYLKREGIVFPIELLLDADAMNAFKNALAGKGFQGEFSEIKERFIDNPAVVRGDQLGKYCLRRKQIGEKRK